jgi:uncharacterized protein YecT (DUF1311 family)
MISRVGYAMILAILAAGCGTQDKGASAVNANASAAGPKVVPKPTDAWSTATTESSMDGKKVVASKKFARLSADGVTKSTIDVALTCITASQSLTVTMRAVDYDKQLKSEVPTHFDSELENLKPEPVGRVKSKSSKPLPLSVLFALKQDDLLLWDVGNLTTVRTFMTGLLEVAADDKKARDVKNQLLLATAQTGLGIPGAAAYADVNSMFSAERPWIIEVSTGNDPVEISVPADSDSVNDVLHACGANPPSMAKKEIPTLEQVFEAANSGDLPRAQEMMDLVLQEHPNSAKAHFVAARLLVKEGNAVSARGELSKAESIDSGLSFATPDSVKSLKASLDPGSPTKDAVAGNVSSQAAASPTTSASFDCVQASTAVEKMICASPSLAVADSEMAAEYKRIYSAAGPNAGAVKQGQREFIANRNACTTADCVADAYKERRVGMAQLNP